MAASFIRSATDCTGIDTQQRHAAIPVIAIAACHNCDSRTCPNITICCYGYDGDRFRPMPDWPLVT